MATLQLTSGNSLDDDLYSGFDAVHPALDTRLLEQDQGFQQAVRTSYGRRPPVS